MPTLTMNNRDFKWSEVSRGTNRSINLSEDGVANSSREFALKWIGNNKEVNIHECPDYNKQAKKGKIYSAIATQAITHRANNNVWPNPGFQINYNGDTFVLRDR